jgi:opacity protein-like surface antigen
MHAARRICLGLAAVAAAAAASVSAASAAMPRADKAETASIGHAATYWKKRKWHDYRGRRHYRGWRDHGWYGKPWRKHRYYGHRGPGIAYGYTYVRPVPRRYIYRYHPYVYERPYVRVRPIVRGYYGRHYRGGYYRW